MKLCVYKCPVCMQWAYSLLWNVGEYFKINVDVKSFLSKSLQLLLFHEKINEQLNEKL